MYVEILYPIDDGAIRCTNSSCSDKPAVMEGFPMKSWNIEIYLLDEAGNEKPATCFTKAVYNLLREPCPKYIFPRSQERKLLTGLFS
jgi:hypothetical protein